MTGSLHAADPLAYSRPLPIVRTFYPMGFGLELSTDSREIEKTAESLWSRYSSMSELPPVRLRVAVSESDAEVAPLPGMPKGQGHLLSIAHGAENFAVADLACGFGFACLSRDVAADRAYTIHHFLEPMAYMLLSAARLTMLHAACVSLKGRGVLLAGDSGAGKTCLAYACAVRGWTFISGDASALVRDSFAGRVAGRPFAIRFRESALSLFPELNGYSPKRGMNGKLDIEPPVEDLGIETAVEARVMHVVFLKRRMDPVGASVETMSREEAYRRLDQSAMFGDPELLEDYRTSLARFLVAQRAYELTYSDVEGAERALRMLTGERVS